MKIDDTIAEIRTLTKHPSGDRWDISDSQMVSLLTFAHTAGIQEGIAMRDALSPAIPGADPGLDLSEQTPGGMK